jgi:hypothetical protein
MPVKQKDLEKYKQHDVDQLLATDFSPRLEETARLLLRGTPFDSIGPVDL